MKRNEDKYEIYLQIGIAFGVFLILLMAVLQ